MERRKRGDLMGLFDFLKPLKPNLLSEGLKRSLQLSVFIDSRTVLDTHNTVLAF